MAATRDEAQRSSDMSGWDEREAAQAAAYDAIGDRYDQAFPHKDGQIACCQRLIDRLRPASRVLDVGCGTGLPTAAQVTAAGHAVTALDISPTMLALTRRNVPGAHVVQADVLDLGGPRLPVDAPFDAVVAFFSLLNLPRKQLAQALTLIHQALVPGGPFALAMVEADLDDVPIAFLGSRLRVTGYLRDELRCALETAGFAIEVEDTRSYAPASTQAQPEIQLFLNCRQRPADARPGA